MHTYNNAHSRKAAFDVVIIPLKIKHGQTLPAIQAGKVFSLLQESALRHKSAIIYLAIGGSAALIDFFLFLLFYKYFGLTTTLSTVFSISVSTVYGFGMNAFFNFKVSDKLIERFLSYALVSAFAAAASSVSLFLFTDTLNFDGTFVKAVTLPIIALCQYFLNKTYSFSI